MPYKPTERQYRTFAVPLQCRAAEAEGEEREQEYIVEGYATTFDDPYVMFTHDGVDYSEQIDRDALTEADMSDVLFLYNHEGMVFARISNDTLTVSPNERGLYVRADLGRTEDARRMYEAIKAGMVTTMSWAFTIADGGDSYDEDTHTRTITRVKKVYDVSAVSLPANPNTDISARAFFDGVIEKEQERRRERERVEELRTAIAARLEGNK